MKKIFYPVITAFLLLSCENDDLNDNSSRANETNNVTDIVPMKSLYYDGIYEIRDGKEIDLTYQQYLTRSTQEFYEIASLNPVFTYLGAVLRAESINSGEYGFVAYPNALKPEIRIAFSLPVKSKVISPKYSSFYDAVIDAIGDRDFSGKQSQVFSYKMKEFNYYKEVNMVFGANIKIGQLFSITTSVENDKKQSNTALFIDFSQTYFNVAMDIPDDGNIFLNENERQKYLSQKPVYINSVNMGRKGVMIVESEESYSDISVSIRTAFNAGIVNGELSLDSKTKEMLKRAQIYIYIIGGDADGAAKVVSGFPAFQDFIIKGGVYSKEVFGVPISFSGANASDNSMFISKINI
jgi:thiol-activated cytolysin